MAEIVRYSHLKNHLLAEEHEAADIIIACDDDGEPDEFAEVLVKDYFAAHPEINLLYGDEDRVAEDGVHLDPWFKSEWAPDTFLSTFYFGNVIAFRSSAFAMINPGQRKTSAFESAASLREDSLDEERARNNEDDGPVRSWIYGTLCLKLAPRRRTADTQRDLRAIGMSSRSVMCRRYSTTDTTGWSCGTEI